MKELTEISGKLQEIEKGFRKTPYPRSIVIEVSARCNLDCIQCAQSAITREKGDMDLSLFNKIIDDVAEHSPGANVWLSNYGEPLMVGHRIYDMVSYATEKGIRNTYMNTNGSLLTDEMADWLIDAKLGHIIVGIDGYSAEVYESIRVGAKRDEVYNNVLNLLGKMKQKGVTSPRIEAQFIVMEENEHEIDQYRKFWAKHGVAVRVRSRITWAGRVSPGNNINDKLERIACGNTFSTCHIIWSGHVTACGNDVDAQFILGDLNKESISNVWQRKARDFVDLHLTHQFDKLPAYCQNCVDWQAIGTVDYDERGERYYRTYDIPEQ